MIRFTVPCIPVAQPRQRHRIQTAQGRTFSRNYIPGKHPIYQFKSMVRVYAQQQYKGEVLEGPLTVSVSFIMPRPMNLRWKKRPMPRQWHGKLPDIDNLFKALADSLSGIIWKDDSQIAKVTLEKHIASGDEQPSVSVEVARLAEVPA